MEMSDERKASFSLSPSAPLSARDWFAKQTGFPIDLRERVVLLLSELVANSVSHSGLASPDEVDISVRSIPGGLRVEVIDQGIGIADARPADPTHFGLRLVDSVTDRWGYTNDPTCVWFEISGDGA
jgi:anti-sigma regulatory factor (Ser/Thr protein kinase)